MRWLLSAGSKLQIGAADYTLCIFTAVAFGAPKRQ